MADRGLGQAPVIVSSGPAAVPPFRSMISCPHCGHPYRVIGAWTALHGWQEEDIGGSTAPDGRQWLPS